MQSDSKRRLRRIAWRMAASLGVTMGILMFPSYAEGQSGIFNLQSTNMLAKTQPLPAEMAGLFDDANEVVEAAADVVVEDSDNAAVKGENSIPYALAKAAGMDTEPLQSVVYTRNKQGKSKVAATMAAEAKELDASSYRGIVYTPDDVRKPSGMTLEQLKCYVSVFCKPWIGLEEEILKYDSEVNLVFLLSVGRWETWGGEACVGEYNSFNIKYDDKDVYVDYDSYIEGIDAFVRLIRDRYLAEDGAWHEGVSVESIGMHYATPAWAPVIADYGYELIDYIADNEI